MIISCPVHCVLKCHRFIGQYKSNQSNLSLSLSLTLCSCSDLKLTLHSTLSLNPSLASNLTSSSSSPLHLSQPKLTLPCLSVHNLHSSKSTSFFFHLSHPSSLFSYICDLGIPVKGDGMPLTLPVMLFT